MDATPIDLTQAQGLGELPAGLTGLNFADAPRGATTDRWAALHEAAAVVATLAGLAREPLSPRVRAFPAAISRAGAPRRALAEQGIEDICAMMEPGLAALLTVHTRGGDAKAPAAALWQEFRSARDAVLALAPPPGLSGDA